VTSWGFVHLLSRSGTVNGERSYKFIICMPSLGLDNLATLLGKKILIHNYL